MSGDDRIIADQIEYYRARAGEYDEWFERTGRYDFGAAEREAFKTEERAAEAALGAFGATGDGLEIACGTGWWTSRLVGTAASLTCIDAAPETITLNRKRLSLERKQLPEFVATDVFAWEPPRRFDFVAFCFWLSHVPSAKFDGFWAMVERALKPGGRVFFLDTPPSRRGVYESEPASKSEIELRRLKDGSEHRAVKIYYEPQALVEKLRALGWAAEISAGKYFLIGTAKRN
jgi:demethylmenaquinone methyltransferase/2-methoxy-6-polyprenyl-1,4-benzoquinol methylase